MKSSPYPVLKNRPIDQWKVIELKEELKRRKLATKGLKDDLIKRLNEALRAEMESSNQEDVENGDGEDDSQPKGQDNADDTTPIANVSAIEVVQLDSGVDIVVKDAEKVDGKSIDVDDAFAEAVADDVSQSKGQDNDDVSQPKGEDNADETTAVAKESVIEAAEVDEGVDVIVKGSEDQADDNNAEFDNVPCQGAVIISDQNSGQQAAELTHVSPAVKDESVTDEKPVDISNTAYEDMSFEAALPGQGSENEHDNKILDSTTQQDAEDLKPSYEEVKQTMTHPNNQVSEVSHSVGFPVKNDSLSTDSISINEKNELKDDIIADDVKLEPDIKHEMVQPSSSPLVPDVSESRPMDVEVPQSEVFDDETKISVKDEDMSKKNSSADLGSPEKLNLDRSSCDDSMEEDTLENKQVDSTYNSNDVGIMDEKNDVTMVRDEKSVDITNDELPAADKDGNGEAMVAFPASTDKRKLSDDQEAVNTNNEPSKRQRRWKTESIKASEEPQNSSTSLSTTPKAVPQALLSKQSFSRSNSNASDEGPKERVVPPPSKPPTDSLRIDNFVRPFTLKAVQELLGKTGTVASFWMDHIKTHCYVTYSSVDEATETRNAVYNLQWPTNGGRLLTAEFVDAEEVKSHVEGPTQAPPPAAPPSAPVAPPQSSPRQLGLRQKQLIQTNLPPPPPLTNPPPVREHLQPPPPPPLTNPPPVREHLQPPPPPPLEKVEPPVLTLDDLFRKTKTTPRIYYLPLTDEQVKAKSDAQRRN